MWQNILVKENAELAWNESYIWKKDSEPCLGFWKLWKKN